MRTRVLVALALALAVGLTLGVSPYASSSPDGLERVAADEGFLARGSLHLVQKDAPLPDYAVPGISDPRLATGLAGFVGTLVAFALAGALGRLLTRRREGRQAGEGA